MPVTRFDSKAIEFDFPGLLIGVAEYEEGPTGATVFYFPNRVHAAVDVRGGSPGTVLTVALENGYSLDRKWVDAISFAGGSSFGLEAAAGVMYGLLKKNNYSTERIPGVPGAIIWDFKFRDTSVYPDKALGLAAFEAAEPNRFYVGARGAGRSAGVGSYFGLQYAEQAGQGAAVRSIGDVKVAVFTVVNAVGVVVDRAGNVVRGNYDPRSGERRKIVEDPKFRRLSGAGTDEEVSSGVTSNTTLTLLVTNQVLDYASLRRLATTTHTSMARGIQPFQLPADGDVFFAVTTAEVDDPDLSFYGLSTVASEVAWDAVLSAFPEGHQ